jgi:flagellum-specific ATP synthase
MNHHLDEAVQKIDAINAFLQQKVDEKFSFDETVTKMKEL